jgi:RimJ/RimL family protein N-acetyltransferase
LTDLVIRPLHAGEQELFESMPDPAHVGVAATGRDYRRAAAAGEYRPEWTWVALRAGQVVGRAAWWGGPGDDAPAALDWLDFGDDLAVGAALVRAAPFRCEYILVLPPGWRGHPEVRRAAELRLAAAERAGMRPLVERLHYVWTPAAGLPERPGRLRWLPALDDQAVLEILRGVHQGTLDAHARRLLERLDPAAAAEAELADLKWFPAPRAWWRLASTPAGEPLGITVPSRNHTSAIIGLVGVVAGQRGHGYGYDLLVEATHLLVEEGATEIVADTDTTNTPMVAAFAKAGYPVTGERVFMHWPAP